MNEDWMSAAAAHDEAVLDSASDFDLDDPDEEWFEARKALDESMQSTLDHIERIHRKVDRLLAARDDAIAQAGQRAWSEEGMGVITVEEASAWRERFRMATKGDGSGRKPAAAPSIFGGGDRLWQHRRDVQHHLRHDPNEDYGWSGGWERVQHGPVGATGSWTTHGKPSDPYPPKGQAVVYVLFLGLDPAYVGSTGDLCNRLRAHSRDGKVFDRWMAISCVDRGAAYAMEDRVLKERFPKLNKRRGA